jgi:PAS domain S-box-containing protein
MKQLALRATILGSFGLALLILFVLSLVTYRSLRLALDSSRRVAHTQDVIATTEACLSLLKDAETGQRGYLITGSERYLEPYQTARAELPQLLTKLRDLVANNAGQQQHLAAVEPLMMQKLAELQETIDLRANHGFAAAQAVVLTDRGKQTMDALRALAHNIEHEEHTLLQQRQAATEASATKSVMTLVAGNAFAFVVVGLAGFAVNRDLRRRQQAEHELTMLNTTLEQQVADRTAALHQALAAERIQREYFQTTLGSIGDAVIVTDHGGAVNFLNQVAEDITGWTTAEAHGKPLPEVFRIENEQTGQPVENPIAKVLRTGGIAGLANHTILFRKDGSTCPIDDSAAPIRDDQERVLGVILVFRDITERRRAEEVLEKRTGEIQRVNEELQQFAHIVSHDLNEPLRTMINFVQLLARRFQGKLDATAEEYIAFVTDAAQRMQQMLTDLLAYTRVGGPTTAFTAVNCEALLARVLADLQLCLADRKAEVTNDPLPTVQGDETRLGQVFHNLIGNALKFCGQNPPRIHVSVQRDGDHWRFAVRDNGIGIDPPQATRVFQVFQRLHTRKEYTGTGIGLAICKKIVEQHGGRIWVESTPGEGATFYFTILENGSQHSEVGRMEKAISREKQTSSHVG